MTIRAKYPGKCRKCGQMILAGAIIEWEKRAGAAHVECPAGTASHPGPANAIKISGGSGYGCQGWSAGDVVRNPYHGNAHYGVLAECRIPEYLYVLTSGSRYYREEGMSFGVGDDRGYTYHATCRPATDGEAAPLVTARVAREANNTRIAELREFYLNFGGEYPEGTDNIPEGDMVPIGKGQNLYGGGAWFVIGPEKIWYVRNNGADGDDWSRNNVRTGGAGAIGKYRPYSDALRDEILRLTGYDLAGEKANR